MSINYLSIFLLWFEMRVRGMMNDYSQHRVLVTVLFIPDRETGGGGR